MPTAFMPAPSATTRSEPASGPSPAKPAAQPETPRYDPRTRALIEGPIVPILLRLAAPNVLVMLAQTSVGLVDYFVGMLGTDALAGVALVFPVVMLMQMRLPQTRRRRRRGRGVALLRDRQRRLCRLSAFRPLRRSLEAVRRSFALAATRGHSARRRGCRADHR